MNALATHMRDAMSEFEHIRNRPTGMHGRRIAVEQLMSDADIERTAKGTSDLLDGTMGNLFGIDIHYDETMPENLIEMRRADGSTSSRLVRISGAWYEFKTEQ